MPTLNAADSTINSKICTELDAPTITEPAADLETNDDAILVSGLAEAAQVVTVTRNNTGAGAVVAGPDGSFEVLVPLAYGQNAIRAQVSNDCDTVRASAAVTVTRLGEPEQPEQPGEDPEPQPEQPTTQTPIPGLDPVTGQRPSQNQGGQSGQQPDSGHAAPLTRPRITYPTGGLQFSEGQIRVTGTADVGSVVIIIVNGDVVAQVNVSDSGNWAVTIGLQAGTNTIQAQASRDGQTASSEQVSVEYARTGVSRLMDRPYDLTVQIICILFVILLLGLLLFTVRRYPRVRDWFAGKKQP
jgi:hypothetical protein